jgi:hypothetical protein
VTRNGAPGGPAGSDNVPAVSLRLRPALLPALLLAAFVAGGCAGDVVDARKLEAAVRAETMVKTGTKIAEVDCPTDLRVIPGTEFECSVTAADGAEARAELKILNDRADVDFVRLAGA